ncbi:class I adenylate-forming enzyme family protein [Azospirillum doebereinerae]|uniref:ATP-dependent acyl-CoA ligase n=1 Tax=Azospirillum doebereinerae TaxID=92933 RepID=A0A433J9Q7_9PROT|nr:AMP-binding protein [Azospirillum doebereinerae]MCG5238709.1 AMP-binding protein [Azospirillum doebereinerae]RUQ72032.1 ATP-dependent acyl-CoA ligase [Azospirillum doebereinerae]
MIADPLYARAAATPDRPFLLFGDRTITYGAMAALVDAAVKRLAGQGVRAGQTVAMMVGNRPGFLVAWFALSELGAIAVPINTALVGEGLRYLLEQSEASLLIAEDAFRDSLPALAPPLVPMDERFEETAATAWTPRQRLALSGGTANAILYTSGTTGLPKGAVISNACYELAGAHMAAALELTEADRILVFLPLFHANPQMYGVMSCLHAGAVLALLPRFSASRLLDDVRRYGATGFTYVGTVLSILAKRLTEADHDHTLRWAVGGGAPPSVWRDIEERLGIALRELYGMTETGGWVTMNTAAASRFGSVGAPRPDTEVQVVDADDNPVPPGVKGEIVTRPGRPGLMFDGYWKKPEATVAATRNLWLHTGDRGAFDADGFLHFDGRMKELIRRGGEMIAPAEIELALLKHPAVQDCAVVGVPDDVMGEEIKAVVVPRPGFVPRDVETFLQGRVPGFMIPRFVETRPEIPKTATQKVQRHLLLERLPSTVDLRPTGTGR